MDHSTLYSSKPGVAVGCLVKESWVGQVWRGIDRVERLPRPDAGHTINQLLARLHVNAPTLQRVRMHQMVTAASARARRRLRR